MTRRLPMTVAVLALAGLALVGCAPQGPAEPVQTTPSPTQVVPSPTPTPTPEPVPEPTPEPDPEPVAGSLDADAVIDAAIAKDAGAVVAQLGDPVRVVDLVAGIDGARTASEATSDLTNVLGIGENFKPGDPSDVRAAIGSQHPEFAADDAVVMVGTQGTVLSFIPGAFLRANG